MDHSALHLTALITDSRLEVLLCFIQVITESFWTNFYEFETCMFSLKHLFLRVTHSECKKGGNERIFGQRREKNTETSLCYIFNSFHIICYFITTAEVVGVLFA